MAEIRIKTNYKIIISRWYFGWGAWIDSIEGKPLLTNDKIKVLRNRIERKFGTKEDKIIL